MPRLLLATLALLTAAATSLAAPAPLKPVAKVDLHRFAGSWRLIAVMDNRLEHNFVDAQETYAMQPGGRVAIHLTYREKSFTAPLKSRDLSATILPDGSNAHWKLHVLPFLSLDYIVIDLTPDYQVVVIANPSRKFGAILARPRTLTPAAYHRGLRALKDQGYDTTKLLRLPQVPPAKARK